MLTPDGRVKILDFGLARFASEAADAAGQTSTGIVLGTVDFIAPEQADNAHEADIRSDIYSLGCTLYHLLAGRPPFPTGTPIQKMMAHAKKKPQPLTEIRPDLPEGIMPVLERMMAKNPKHRYQTPAEVAIALEPFAATTAIARAPGPQPRARATDPDWTVLLEKPPVDVRRRRLVAVATAIMFVVAALLGAAVYRIATDKGELVITSVSDDVKVVITSGGKLVDVIDTKTDKLIRLSLRSGEYELELKGAPEGLKLNIDKATLTRGKETLAKIEHVEKVREVRRFRGHRAMVGPVAFSPNGKLAASGGGGVYLGNHNWGPNPDNAVRLWDVTTGREIRRLEGHDSTVVGLAFSPDSSLLASCGSWDQTLRIWEVATGKQLHCLRGHNAKVYAVAFLPDGRQVLSGGHDGLVRLWDVKRGQEVRKFERNQGAINAVAVSPDGRRAASGGNDKTARLWEVETGKELRQFRGHTGGISDVAFSPDGRLLLSTDAEGEALRLWDVESGKELRRFQGHTDWLNHGVFTPDGRRILSSSFDGTLRLWDVETGKELYCITGHTSAVFGIAISPDGRYALSGSNDKTARLWRLPDPPPAKKKP
jgi:WD40 repeat protein